MLVLSLTLGAAAWVFSACGGSDNSTTPLPPQPGKGALYTLIADTPFCDVLTFRVNIKKLALIPQGGGQEVVVFGPTVSTAPSIKVNFAGLRDSSTILDFSSVQEGAYDQATVEFSGPELIVFDPTQSPPSKMLTANLTTLTPKVSINPPLQIVKDKIQALRLEFDLVRSINTDSQGQVTGDVTPTIKFTPVTASGPQGFGRMDDLEGFVRSVTPASPAPDFTGSFLLQLLAGFESPAVNVNLTSTTRLLGLPALNQLATGSFVELDGFVDDKGNLVAISIEVEDREDTNQKKVAFLGFVTAMRKDSSGNLTNFDLFVRETQPDAPFDIPLDSTVVVNASPTTTYQFSSRGTNFANLVFDPTALTVGQEVVVHGKYTKPPTPPPTPVPPTTVAADSIYLKLQTLQGSFSSLVQASGDDKTGAFRFAACSSLPQPKSAFVFTNSQTAFVNVVGLSGLAPQTNLLVKGLPFFEPLGTTIQGIPVPPGTLVIVAKQVHQF